MFQRVVSDIGVTIECLRIPRLRHNAIRLREPPQRRMIIPRVHKHQPGAIVPLTCEPEIGW